MADDQLRENTTRGMIVLLVFLGAFLLFLVQPLFGKIILPWFGGSPSVWTTCMLFFQVALLLGYLYAHFLSRWFNFRVQYLVHASLLVVACILFSVSPDTSAFPQKGSQPIRDILSLMFSNIGAPYVLLAATGPLMQAWFARQCPHRSPYPLYAVSNVASFVALLGYPLLLVPRLSVVEQTVTWDYLFRLFAVLTLVLSFWLASRGAVGPAPIAADEGERPQSNGKSPWYVWILLPALACSMLLAVTNHLCQDMAVIPLFWVIPLSVYLLSFVFVFQDRPLYSRRLFAWLVLLLVLVACLSIRREYLDVLFAQLSIAGKPSRFFVDAGTESILFISLLFAACMLCHGEVIRRKPEPSRLTGFYLAIATGGALGGIFVSLVCPLLFTTYFELNVCIVALFVVALLAQFPAPKTGKRKRKKSGYGRLFAVLLPTTFVAFLQLDSLGGHALDATRNFYGTLQVQQLDAGLPSDRLVLQHGRIVHGMQWRNPDRELEPTTYYAKDTGVGKTLGYLQGGSADGVRVGIVGLGVGTLAAYSRPADAFTFYEINPAVDVFAKRFFTFLGKAEGEVDTRVGDARLLLQAESPQGFDLLVLDAFSSDSIPVHLITKEAFEVYSRHLAANGVILVHISNRHLDVAPVLARLAQENGWYCGEFSNAADAETRSPVSDTNAVARWVFLSDSQKHFEALVEKEQLESLRDRANEVRLWTDQYSDLLSVMHFW